VAKLTIPSSTTPKLPMMQKIAPRSTTSGPLTIDSRAINSRDIDVPASGVSDFGSAADDGCLRAAGSTRTVEAIAGCHASTVAPNRPNTALATSGAVEPAADPITATRAGPMMKVSSCIVESTEKTLFESSGPTSWGHCERTVGVTGGVAAPETAATRRRATMACAGRVLKTS